MSNKQKRVGGGEGGAERHPQRVFLIAHKRMLRSLRNFLTFPKYQKQKKSKNLSFIFLTLPLRGGGLPKPPPSVNGE